jgi:hypothetical protein
MNIAKRLYQELTPKQRAIALYAAMNRQDQVEANRLVDQAPRRAGHGKAILGIGQALDAYNRLVSQVTRDLLLVVGESMAARSFCIGWLSAGGTVNNEEYRKNCLIAETLSPICESHVGEMEAVCQAAREWCEKNDIPVDLFSGPLCFLRLKKATEDTEMLPIDGEIMAMMRSVFDAIKLIW